MDWDGLLVEVRARKPAALARVISLVENQRNGFERILSAVHPHLGQAHRIGITGPPGAGKSTLTEAVVKAYRARGLTVAVVAVDPTSPFTGGALLGDRIRMESVALDEGVFIRSMATRGSLGGLATATREVCDVLDAAGFDRIVVETVGVGQSELAVSGMADTSVLVLVPESGDSIQTLKSGIMEIADVFVVNKADRPGADRLRQEIEVALGIRQGRAFRSMTPHHGAVVPGHGPVETVPQTGEGEGSGEGERWRTPVLLAVATLHEGVGALVNHIEAHAVWLRDSGELDSRRRTRMLERTRDVLERATRRWLWTGTGADRLVADRLEDIAAGRVSPYDVAAKFVGGLAEQEGRSP